MKKTMKLFWLVCLVLLACVLVLTGCDEEEKPNDTNDDITDDNDVNDNGNNDKHTHTFVNGFCSCGTANLSESEGLAYELSEDGKSYMVTGIGNCTDTVIIIPSTYNELPVSEIAYEAFKDCTHVTSITIPDSITSINARAFYGCTGITEITIPKSVTSIGTQIFYKASNLHTVYYNSPYNSNDNTFLNENSISKIVFAGSYLPSNIFYNNTYVKEVIIEDGVTSINDYAFYNCTSLVSITIPSSVTNIGECAFEECRNLTGVYINDITSWCHITFDGYDNSNPLRYAKNLYDNNILVSELILPDSVTKISNYAFYGCTSLTSIIIPDSVRHIGMDAFHGCTNLTNITIPNTITSICEGTFYGCRNLTDVIIPNSVTEIGDYAFSVCTRLNNVTIPDSVTNIGEGAFRECTSLTSITIPDSYNIRAYTFSYCTSLTSIVILDGVPAIEESAFFECTNLMSISIPNSITKIDHRAFYNCSNLMKIIYAGTKADWNEIVTGFNWDGETGNYTIHCSDGTITK